MSFQDLEASCPSAISKGWSQFRPQTCSREDATSFERDIRTNIRDAQEELRGIDQRLAAATISAQGRLSRRARTALQAAIERGRELEQGTERLFRDWQVHLAGAPAERLRKKPSFDKLRHAFGEQVVLLRDAAFRAAAAERQAALAEAVPDADFSQALAAEDEILEQLLPAQACDEGKPVDVQLYRRIAEEQDAGIRRIQDEVSEVNDMFRELASVVLEQGRQLDSIDEQADSAAATVRSTVQEVKKSARRQTGTRDNLFYLLVATVCMLLFFVLSHLTANGGYLQPVPLSMSQGIASGIRAFRGAAFDFGTSPVGSRITTVVGATVRG